MLPESKYCSSKSRSKITWGTLKQTFFGCMYQCFIATNFSVSLAGKILIKSWPSYIGSPRVEPSANVEVHFSQAVWRSVKPKFHYSNFSKTCPWRVSWGSFGKVSDSSHGKSRDTGMFRGFKPSRHIQMVLKNSRDKSATSPFALRIQGKTRGSRRRRGQINRYVTGSSRTSWGNWHSGIWALACYWL